MVRVGGAVWGTSSFVGALQCRPGSTVGLTASRGGRGREGAQWPHNTSDLKNDRALALIVLRRSRWGEETAGAGVRGPGAPRRIGLGALFVRAFWVATADKKARGTTWGVDTQPPPPNAPSGGGGGLQGRRVYLAAGGGGGVYTYTKASIRIMLKLRGSTFLLSYIAAITMSS